METGKVCEITLQSIVNPDFVVQVDSAICDHVCDDLEKKPHCIVGAPPSGGTEEDDGAKR